MLPRAVFLLSLTSCLLFFASAETENAKPVVRYGSNTEFARQYISAARNRGPPNLRGDAGPEVDYKYAYEEEGHEPYPSRGQNIQSTQGADRNSYVNDIDELLESLREPNSERPGITSVEIEQEPKGPGMSTSSSLNYDRLNNMVDIEQDRRKPKGPGTMSASPSLNYDRFGNMVDIEQDRRKPKGPGTMSAYPSLKYDRFGNIVDIEQDRRKPKGPGTMSASPSLNYDRFGNMVDIEQDRRKPKGPGTMSAYPSLKYDRFGNMVDIEQDRRKPKGPGTMSASPSLNYDRFGNMVDIEQDRRKPKGPGTMSAYPSLNYDRFGNMVDIEQDRRKPKGPGTMSAYPSLKYDRFGNMVDIEQDRRKPKGPGTMSAYPSLHYDRFGNMVDIEQDRRKPKGPGTMSAYPSLNYDRFGNMVDIEQDRRKLKGPGMLASPSMGYGRFVNVERGPKMPDSYSSNYGRVDIEHYNQKLKGSPAGYAYHGRYGEVEQNRRKLKGPGLVDYKYNDVDIQQDRRKPIGPWVMPQSYGRADTSSDAPKQRQSVHPARYYDYLRRQQNTAYMNEIADLDSSDYTPPRRQKGDYGKFMERIAESDVRYILGPSHNAYEQGTARQTAIPKAPVVHFPDREMAWETGMERGSLSEQQGSFVQRQHANEPHSLQTPGYKPGEFMIQRQDNPEG